MKTSYHETIAALILPKPGTKPLPPRVKSFVLICLALSLVLGLEW